jgi:hypothetical protein
MLLFFQGKASNVSAAGRENAMGIIAEFLKSQSAPEPPVPPA